MTTPMRHARAATLQGLYQAELLKVKDQFEVQQLLGNLVIQEKLNAGQEEYLRVKLAAILEETSLLDDLIRQASPRWRVERMGVIDRNILRLGCYELSQCPDLGHEIILNEAVELAKTFGSEDSPRFVNGILQELVGLVRHQATPKEN